MNVSLMPELERLVLDKVNSGMYQTSSEVIREGLRLLKERDYQIEAVRSKIKQGIDEVGRGQLIDFVDSDGMSVADRVKTRGRQKLASQQHKPARK